MPSDPFEAELLMMAEAVASAEKSNSSGSDTEIDEPSEYDCIDYMPLLEHFLIGKKKRSYNLLGCFKLHHNSQTCGGFLDHTNDCPVWEI